MDYFSGWCKSERRLEGFTIIVTGSNTGIGRETAADLYRRAFIHGRVTGNSTYSLQDVIVTLGIMQEIKPPNVLGAYVIMACRNIITAEEAKDDIEQSARELAGTGELVVEELDLCSLESVRAFCACVTSRGGRLRGLVCNAGVMMCPEGRTRDGFETHIASNHLGHALLTLLLLPVLIQNAPSRIVFVSSIVHHLYKLDLDDINLIKTKYTPLQAYSNSKIANILFAKALDLKLKEHNIKGVSTYSLHPGVVQTGIVRHFPQTAWNIITYLTQNHLFRYWCQKTPRCGAQTSIYCAVDEKCGKESGFYYSDCAKTFTSRQCQSESEAERLWNVTIDMLNLRDYDPFTQDSAKLFEQSCLGLGNHKITSCL